MNFYFQLLWVLLLTPNFLIFSMQQDNAEKKENTSPIQMLMKTDKEEKNTNKGNQKDAFVIAELACCTDWQQESGFFDDKQIQTMCCSFKVFRFLKGMCCCIICFGCSEREGRCYINGYQLDW